MSRIGELLHADCHHLSKGITITAYKKLYLVGIIDGYSRCAWVEVTTDIKALTVMFAILRCLNILRSRYNIEAEVILTDNGAEFGKGALVKNKDTHPFKRLLGEMGIKHRYTRAYHPQTNGKIERFWKTLQSDFLEDSLYEDIDDLREELLRACLKFSAFVIELFDFYSNYSRRTHVKIIFKLITPHQKYLKHQTRLDKWV